MDVSEACELARRLLADDLPQRWNHVQGVARRAELFADQLPSWKILKAAAYLHDIGYARPAFDTGYHQLDGARYLRRLGCDESIINLVGNHSEAALQAEALGLGPDLAAEVPMDESLPHRQLHFCDLTTSLDGAPISVDERLADLRFRHANNPPKIQYLDGHEVELRRMVAAIWAELDTAGETAAEAS